MSDAEKMGRIAHAAHEQASLAVENLQAVKGEHYARAVRLCLPVYSYWFAMELVGGMNSRQEGMLTWLLQNHVLEVANQFKITPERLLQDCKQISRTSYNAAFAQEKALRAQKGQ